MSELYRIAVDTMPHAILILDERLRVILINRSCEELIAKPGSEILGSDLQQVVPYEDLRNQVLSVLESGGSRVVELHPEEEFAGTLVLRAVVTTIAQSQTETSDWGRLCLIVLEDVSERIDLEQQLVQSEKLAAMGSLASTVAHEIGNPLAIVVSTLDYMRDSLTKAGDDSHVKSIDAVMDGTGQIRELLRGLSEFTNTQRPHYAWVDLCGVVSSVLVFVRREAEQRNISISRAFQDGLPACQVDLASIRQVILNVVKNAIEAMPAGGDLRVGVNLSTATPDKAEEMVRISISDTGIGIRETDIRSIYRPFYSTKSKGTGLGLSFCRRVVEEHGGWMTVNSRLGEGSTFTIVLPVRQEETS